MKKLKFAVIGDYDQKYINIYKNIMEESEFTLLDNTNKLIYYKSIEPINIIGLTNTENINELYTNSTYNITLIHKPDLIKNINNTNLAFAGHS